ncbi:AAA family ATPase [Devosia sp.]|uniref:AAA family ATPase n=1 Tax=Devosia sp. TaxID=1871048 RepID=UPI003A8E297B
MIAEGPDREADQLENVPVPESQPVLIGHGEAMDELLARLAAGRMPGGVLIHGPRGIGKATFAFQLARSVFAATSDEDPAHIDAQVTSGSFPNLFVLRKATRDTGKGFYTVIRVEEIRAFVDQLRKTRGRAGHRIAIIDAIDDCNASSANALLKILEEPPADTTFLLVSHRPGSLLPTIRSRCVQVALRPISADDTRRVLEANGSEGELDFAVALAAGRPRRGFEALKLADGGTLDRLRNWLADPGATPPAARLALADALGANRDSAELRFARDLIFDSIAAEATDAARSGDRRRLASANELWEKAELSLADTDEYNLDMRQTLVAILDAIWKHQQNSVATVQP